MNGTFWVWTKQRAEASLSPHIFAKWSSVIPFMSLNTSLMCPLKRRSWALRGASRSLTGNT